MYWFAMNQTKFSDFNLVGDIQWAIKEAGYENPTPIQEKAIPSLLEGKDLLGCAQTGTGKTAAFALPILHRLSKNPRQLEPKQTRVLVLAPTRELAIQIYDSFRVYGKNLRLKYAVVFGGVNQSPQVGVMRGGVDILVATPGRLLDLIGQRHLALNKVEIFVLDEADRMLDMGFLPDIKKVIQLLPPKRQNLFFSATMPREIQNLAHTLLVNPVKVEVTPVASTVEIIDQSVMYVEKSKKKDLLRTLLKQREFKSVIVFARTKNGANRIVEMLEKNSIPSEAIHGNKSQNARQRALENFRTGRVRVLVATDIAARGIDIDNVSHVINFELPADAESYVHRIGRTARAGASGIAVAFCDAEERAYLKDIERLIGKSIPVVKNHPYHSDLVANAPLMSKGKAKAVIEGNQNFRRHRRKRRGSNKFG